ncbi:uncharacterized protein LOC122624538 [Drosophila teissieri]|uniref:uncharacterized protein LOC122624538 n=1 Tax=Drosophila teissieri TaxID=7243 RepID=UPI001CBA4581|nr:uncharacterized protein LOC122624538 [Drosophila teissieri]
MELLEHDVMPLVAPGLLALDTGTLEALLQGSMMTAPACSGRLPLALKRPGGLLPGLRACGSLASTCQAPRPFAGPRACLLLRMTSHLLFALCEHVCPCPPLSQQLVFRFCFFFVYWGT